MIDCCQSITVGQYSIQRLWYLGRVSSSLSFYLCISLIFGSVDGRFKDAIAKARVISIKQKFDLLVCLGNFFAGAEDCYASDLQDLLSGNIQSESSQCDITYVSSSHTNVLYGWKRTSAE